MSEISAGTGMSGPGLPYAGAFGGFMPYRTGGGATLTFQPTGGSVLGSSRTSFSLAPMSGGMPAMSAGNKAGSRGLGFLGSQSLLERGGSMQSMSGPRGAGVMPPSFAYPFRQPPSLGSSAASATGMSM
jgi:hypothetical protein